MRASLAGLLVWLAWVGPVPAAPRAELWPRWTAHDPASTTRIDHTAWQAFLDRYVAADGAGVNRVAYGRVNAADRRALDAYIDRLATVPISRINRSEQFAYWVNLYNALTVRLVLDHFPVDSIRDIDVPPGLFGTHLFATGPWGKKLVTVAGEALSLDDIEHRILRPIWRDPRIHYVVSCAAVSCPNLSHTAFTGANRERLLDAAARGYVNDPRGVRIEGQRLTVSSLYRWYQMDFGGSDVTVIGHLRRYADPALVDRLANFERIDDDAYDWALNADPPRPSGRRS